MIRRTPRATRPDPRFPYTSLVRSEQVEGADQVLVGNADARAEAGNGVELVVTVDEVLKGDAGDKGDKVSVGTRRGSASCGLDPLPEPGVPWVFFAYGEESDEGLQTNLCSGSTPVDEEIGRASCRERVCQYV